MSVEKQDTTLNYAQRSVPAPPRPEGNWIIRTTGRALRATMYRPGRICRVKVGLGRGIRLEVDADAPLHKYIGTAEIELRRWIRRFAQPGAVCLDVGSYDAHIALILTRMTSAPVWSFEFKTDRLARMHRNLKLNPAISGRVHIIQSFISNQNIGGPEPVDSLDKLVEDGRIPVPDFIKMDVEGAELEALHGALRLLRERKPHMLVETHTRQLGTECMTLLASAGYAPKEIPQRKILREHRGTEQNQWIAAEG